MPTPGLCEADDEAAEADGEVMETEAAATPDQATPTEATNQEADPPQAAEAPKLGEGEADEPARLSHRRTAWIRGSSPRKTITKHRHLEMCERRRAKPAAS